MRSEVEPVGVSRALVVIAVLLATASAAQEQGAPGAGPRGSLFEQIEKHALETQKVLRAPTRRGQYVPLSPELIVGARIQPSRPERRAVIVVLTLKASPRGDEPSVTEAFFQAESWADASVALSDLRSGKVKGLWLELLSYPSGGSTAKWWEIEALEY